MASAKSLVTLGLIERGQIQPVIGAVLPLARVGDAHELLEGGGGFEASWRSMLWARLSSFPRRDRELSRRVELAGDLSVPWCGARCRAQHSFEPLSE